MIGRTLSHYKVLEEISRGGMGIVYKALDLKLNREVALKVLPPQLVADPDRKRRFVQEARAAASLKHPNIGVIHEIDEVDGVDLIAMELIEGELLRDVLARGPLPSERVLGVAIEVAEGLAKAHEKGIVHRDLKPGNIMLSEDGHPKIIDFGLAKLAQPLSMMDSDADTAVRQETEPGRLLGTVAYMSPEQARGQAVDHRSDLFSFGIIVYQALTGVSPFKRASAADTLSAILNEEPPPLTFVEAETGLPIGPDLLKIVSKCLVKKVDGRFGKTAELVSALQTLRYRAEAPQLQDEPKHRMPDLMRWFRRGVAAALVLGVAAVLFIVRRDDDFRPEPSRVSLAVLHFQNLTGDTELDWLRNGLTEMLVTDLSQSPEIDVPSSARVYESLAANELLDESSLSFDGIRKIANDVGAQAVVRGSFARVGDSFRIAFTVEDAEKGTILRADRVEGKGDENLFALMDEVSAAIRNGFEISKPAASPETLAGATTSSLAAWRLYSEGAALANDFKNAEAVVLLERAVEIDPSFALALADLGGIHSNMGHDALAEDYMRRALALADRLPLDDRFGVEGTFYGARWRTLDRAIETYEQGLEVYPEHTGWRNNLARRYAFQERYQEALEQFDRRIEGGSDFAGDYFDAANTRAALGQFEIGYGIVSRYADAHSGEWFAHQGLGWFLTEWGKLDEAEESFDASEAHRQGDWSTPYARWRVEALRENWPEAQFYAQQLVATNEPLARWRGAVSFSRIAVYRGQAREALRFLDEAVASYPEPNGYTALARCWKAELLLEIGDPDSALAESRLAREEGIDEWPERQALGSAALAHQALGEVSEANARIAELRRLWRETGPSNRVEERHMDYVEGRLELARGNFDSALEHLRGAATLLPPKGVEFHWHVYPNHVPVWTALAEAELAAGNTDVAISWFERAAESGSEHVEQPLPFVLSIYSLGKIYDERREPDKARDYYRRFVEYWKDGDMEREQVERAKSKI